MTDAATASRDLSLLAPKFRAAVEAAIAECSAQGLLVKVAEAVRSQPRQAYLYAQGRTRPGNRVTNAPTNLTSWHGYGLAVDVIHATLGYEPAGKNARGNEAWFARVGGIFKKHGCAWGGDWRKPDTPHMQWGNMPASPDASHKALKSSRGNEAVWAAVGAGDGSAAPASPSTQSQRATIRMGDKGPDVAYLQGKLGVAIDSDFGPATDRAAKAFQRSKGLTDDGIVGLATWAALG